MFKFIGSGSAFNTELGNTSAFIKMDDKLLLIDCGGTVFSKIMELKLLEKVTEVNVLITHLHPDHIGSLGDLIFYTFFMLKIKVNVVYPNKDKIVSYLDSIGVYDQVYDFNRSNHYSYSTHKYLMGFDIQPLKTLHYSTFKEFESYGYLFTIRYKTYYYGGDSCNIQPMIYGEFLQNKIHEIYQDTCMADYPNNPHLSLRELSEKIPKKLRKRVFCMHLDNGFDVEKAKKLGFNVVQNQIYR